MIAPDASLRTPHSALRIRVDRTKVEVFCRKWKIVELSFFGSVLRDDFRDDSDVDVLVTFSEDCHWSLLDVIHAQIELAEIIGHDVDLVERKGVERSTNSTRRNHILNNTEQYYVAG